MNRILIDVDNISQVLEVYDQIKVYRADLEAGPYVEITDAITRIAIIPEKEQYYYNDMAGTAIHWYKTTYFNAVGPTESDFSTARKGGTVFEKVGYSFNNYTPPPNEWGNILTADDMRYTYLWGIDCTASDIAETNFEDSQFDFFIREALADFEMELQIDIRKKIYKTRPVNTLIRGKYWREGVDYTDEEDPYPYDPIFWQNFGFIQLRHLPVLSIERATMYNPVQGVVMDLITNGWLRLKKKTGQINLYPTGGQPYGPFVSGVLPWRMFSARFADGFQFDYTTGFPTAEFVPDDLRSIIGKWACIKCLASIGDGLLAGFSSQSVSLDGLSESFSSTQSATSAYFGARIVQYQKEVGDWFKRNRNKYATVPLAFVGY